MIRKILSMNGIYVEIPTFEMSAPKEARYKNIEEAYNDLESSHCGVMDFLFIFDKIQEGVYNVSEMIIATLIFTEGLDGYFIEGGERYRAKYLKINEVDVIYLLEDNDLLVNEDFRKSEFVDNDGNRYKLKSTRELKKR